MKPFYITTSIAYPNAKPHIGYAMELLQADFLARYYRRSGRPVFFLTGLDVHGLKVQQAAEKAGQAPQDFVDERSKDFRTLLEAADIGPDRFIRTCDPDHETAAQALWKMCLAKGDIYKKRYQAWYDIKEEEFLGSVGEHPDPSVFGVEERFLEKIDEENYFFALSRYTEAVLERLETGSYRITPGFRKNEMLAFLRDKGLQDVSISREKSKLSWGVPVPDDQSQVMYVWFDALANYLTPSCSIEDGRLVAGELWPASLQCVGKDIARFHALLWTGMLLSAGLSLPEELLVHGFITVSGEKMSKSLGNVVDPVELISRHGQDPVRWFFLKEVQTAADADFSEERLQAVFTADLANDYGNLVSRVVAMAARYFEGQVPENDVSFSQGPLSSMLVKTWEKYHADIERRDIDKALSATHAAVVFCNRLIEEKKPWVLAKDPEKKGELAALLYGLLECIRQVTAMIAPAMPATADTVSERLGGLSAETWEAVIADALVPGHPLGSEPLILFPRQP